MSTHFYYKKENKKDGSLNHLLPSLFLSPSVYQPLVFNTRGEEYFSELRGSGVIWAYLCDWSITDVYDRVLIVLYQAKAAEM